MLWWVPLLPILASLPLFLSGRNSRRRTPLIFSVVGILLVTGLLLAIAVSRHWSATLAWSDLIVLKLALPPVAATTAFLVLSISFPILLYASVHESHEGLYRLLAGLLFFVGAMLMLVLAGDFLSLLIAWELVGISSWVLIGHKWWEPSHVDDANYALLATRLGDLGLFLAVAVIFTQTGDIGYDAVNRLDDSSRALLAAGVVFAAISKSAQLPFSPWLFRAMSGPTSVSALLHAATMVASGAYLLIRLFEVLQPTAWFQPVVFGIGLVTALTGSSLAILQRHAKRFAAGSTIAHYGLMLVAIGAGYPIIALLHLIAHAAFKGPIFLAIGILKYKSRSWQLPDMMLGRQLPYTAIVSLVAVMALAGIPPLGGGWTKEAVTATAEHLSKIWALTIIVVSGLTACYASRFQMLAFGRQSDEERQKSGLDQDASYKPQPTEKFALAILAAVTLLLSALWLPSIQNALASWFGVKFPPFKAWSIVLSLLAILVGIYGARVMVRTRALHSLDNQKEKLLDWFGLPILLNAIFVRPVSSSAKGLAWLDDRVIDWPFDKAPAFTRRVCNFLQFVEDRMVERFVNALAAAVAWSAARGQSAGEWILDGLPEGSSRVFAAAGQDARALQTGLSHQYYVIVCAGLGIILLVLVFGL